MATSGAEAKDMGPVAVEATAVETAGDAREVAPVVEAA